MSFVSWPCSRTWSAWNQFPIIVVIIVVEPIWAQDRTSYGKRSPQGYPCLVKNKRKHDQDNSISMQWKREESLCDCAVLWQQAPEDGLTAFQSHPNPYVNMGHGWISTRSQGRGEYEDYEKYGLCMDVLLCHICWKMILPWKVNGDNKSRGSKNLIAQLDRFPSLSMVNSSWCFIKSINGSVFWSYMILILRRLISFSSKP